MKFVDIEESLVWLDNDSKSYPVPDHQLINGEFISQFLALSLHFNSTTIGIVKWSKLPHHLASEVQRIQDPLLIWSRAHH